MSGPLSNVPSLFAKLVQLGGTASLRIVISGAAGFIGSHMCDRLLLEGHTVVGLDNFLTGSERNVEHLASHPRFSLIRHDVTLAPALNGTIDAVLHMASPASPK